MNRTIDYYSAPDSPQDCPRCGSPMRRECGQWDVPDVDGRPIVDEQDVCQSPVCRMAYPVTGEEWSLAEIRRRVAAVLGHREANRSAILAAEAEPVGHLTPGEVGAS